MRRAVLLFFAIGCAAPRTPVRLETARITTPAPRPARDEPHEPPASTPDSEPSYEDAAGFAVLSNAAARAHPRHAEAIAALRVYLADLVKAFPTSAQNHLRRTTIRLTERGGEGPLFDREAGAIELPSIDALLTTLHEGRRGYLAPALAAAWLVQEHADGLAEAERLYASAKTKGLTTASFGTDGLTYYAVFSAAWFGRSTLPPDRAALRSADPAGAAFVARTWPIDELAPRPPARDADTRKMHGFGVLVEKRALGHAETTKALEGLDAKLAEIEKIVPPRALATIRASAVIVLRFRDEPEAHGQLFTHDGMIDVLDIRTFLRSLEVSPYALVHEMAHVLVGATPDLAPKIRAAFAAARDAHLYDWARRTDGRSGRPYAATNATEYFAEISKAYLARSEWFPFTRADLEKHDPAGYRLVASAWR